jgi:nicotinate-nucleotide adenylyltransferase
MLLGIFGGSFDPVHNGHLALARACHEQAALDEVWFTPTAIQPLKQNGPHATDAQRIDMLNLAIENLLSEPATRHPAKPAAGCPPRPRSSWQVCTLEIGRGGLSYTVDTLRQIRIELPDARLFFLVGADALRDVPRWREPEEIFRLATPLVVRRAGQSDPDLTVLARLCVDDNKPRLIEMPALDISSSEIRRRLAHGEPIDHLVPAEVAQYIAAHGIYA